MEPSKARMATVHEAVGVFNDVETLQAAIDDLQLHGGFTRYELSVLASDEAIERKLGHIYRRVEDAEDDPEAPRTIFVPLDSLGSAEGGLIGTPLYIAATAATAIVVASGGTLLTAILAATAAGAGGAAIGSVLAHFLSRHHADYLNKQIEHGGILLWVHLRSPDLEQKATEILRKHSAHDVHIHEIPV